MSETSEEAKDDRDVDVYEKICMTGSIGKINLIKSFNLYKRAR